MNIKILKILLSVISGICLGLYFKNIALFIYLGAIVFCIILRKAIYKKIEFDFVLLIISIIIFAFVYYADNKYGNVFKSDIEYYRNC